MNDMIKVVVADDSPFICRLLTSYIESTSDMKVVGMAHSGRETIDMVHSLKPDVLSLDLEMADLHGLEVLKKMMAVSPIPVVVITGVSGKSADTTLKALDLGAVDFILKFSPHVKTDPDILRKEIVAKIRQASKIKVIRSVSPQARILMDTNMVQGIEGADFGYVVEREIDDVLRYEISTDQQREVTEVVVMGASTGGPLALQEILSKLPRNFNATILVVQHLPSSFTSVLAAHLNRFSALSIREAKNGDEFQPGVVLVIPGGYDIKVDEDNKISLIEGKFKKLKIPCPSIDKTMRTISDLYGSKTLGILLTGMGEDGVRGLEAIKKNGGKTFVQDSKSSVVYGMPKLAVERGLADHVAPPKILAHLLVMECA